MKTAESNYPGRYWHALEDNRIQCDLCPRDCKLHEGQRGLCFVRQNIGGQMILTTYGRSSGFCIDPIEKKPLAHWLPGTPVLSFGTAGCNLACRFCQNWEISHARSVDRLSDQASPQAIARAARQHGCRSVAVTYNDPTIFVEYALAVGDACHAEGLGLVVVTAGSIQGQARRDLYACADAANIDLKAFSEDFYRRHCGAALAPVLDTLRHVVHETSAWCEITTLLIPGLNDSEGEIRAECRWIRDELGRDIPLHFSAFHPDGRMRELPSTPPATLRRARSIALEEGLRFVYLGNVHDPEADSTRCPDCGALLIGRDWYQLNGWALDEAGCCRSCGFRLPGRFEAQPGDWGRRRLPIAISCLDASEPV
jgi:pyruvate formate lyase activating enzyme